MSTTPDFRQIILESLEKRGQTRSWLAKQVDGTIHANTVYRYLRGEMDITSGPLAELLHAAGITIVPPKAKRCRVG